jgi:dTMP kinase
LEAQGRAVIHTREPGGTPIGDQIRTVVHSLKNTDMHPHTEVLLYVASRAQLVAQVIRPALAEGKLVVCDRYADSTLAYQGYGHGLDLTALNALLNFATGGLKPDLTLYFDISAEEGLKRRKKDADEGGEFNRLDAYALDFHQKVRKGYAELIRAEPDRWAVIDAALSVDDVHQQVQQVIKKRLGT